MHLRLVCLYIGWNALLSNQIIINIVYNYFKTLQTERINRGTKIAIAKQSKNSIAMSKL